MKTVPHIRILNSKDPLVLFSKVNFCVRTVLVSALFWLAISCTATKQNNSSKSNSGATNPVGLRAGFALPQQKSPPPNIQSVQLHPKGNPGGPPIIGLNSQQKLLLSFDYLSKQSRQFRIEVSHRTQTWEKSSILPSTYLSGFSKAYIQNSQASFSRQPSYQHVEFEFPGSELKPAVSGNYLMEVYSYNDSELLFSMPFFITEGTGAIQARVETLVAQRRDGRPLDQLHSTYQYPDFVEYPQFDLSMSFAQNQFWGQMRKAGELDTFTRGKLTGRLERRQAYIGNYEFKTLDLQSFEADEQQILEYRSAATPPVVILRRDVQNLDADPDFFPNLNRGVTLENQSRNYARVEFSLETDSTVHRSSEIYIVGSFNNWMINKLNKMTYNSNKDLWEGSALIKQGSYAYKYVLVRNNQVDDLALDQGFLSSEQTYFTFIYFKDPDRNFDRLLKISRFSRR